MRKLLYISIIFAFIPHINITFDAENNESFVNQLDRYRSHYATVELAEEHNDHFKNVNDLLNRDNCVGGLKVLNIPVPDGAPDNEIKWNYIRELTKSIRSGGVLGSKVHGSDNVRTLLEPINDVNKNALMHMVIEPYRRDGISVGGVPLERKLTTLAGYVARDIVRLREMRECHDEDLKYNARWAMLLGGISVCTYSFLSLDSPIYIASSTIAGALVGGITPYILNRKSNLKTTKNLDFWKENGLDIARYFEEQGADFLGSFVGSEKAKIQRELEKHNIQSYPYTPAPIG